jgi:hypothetical protein
VISVVSSVQVAFAELSSQAPHLLPHAFVALELAVVDDGLLPVVPLHLPLPLSDLCRFLNPLPQFLQFQPALILQHDVELELPVVVV